MSKHVDITICTVSFNSKPWLDPNWDLTLRLNGLSRVKWIVAENTPANSDQRLSADDTRFNVIAGAKFEAKPHASGSFHHGNGMNKTLEHIDSRYALFLDPDFFIVRRNWINEVIDYMETTNTAIFGAPWHPKWHLKNRYFPCAHCMFVDLVQVPRSSLDFTPDYETVPGYKKRHPDHTDASLHKAARLATRVADPFKFRKRKYIGASHDVSWRIYDRYAADPQIKAECLQPVFHPHENVPAHWIDWALPERFSLTPKKKDYFTEIGFRERGLPDLDSLRWEEFVWNDEPFGFHVRNRGKIPGDHAAAVRSLTQSWGTATLGAQESLRWSPR